MTPEEINQELDQMLNSCDSTAYPMICRKSMTEAGRNYIKSRIIHMVVREGIPIESTLAHIENELEGL